MTSSSDEQSLQIIKFSKSGSHKLLNWRVKEGEQVNIGSVLFEYRAANQTKVSRFMSSSVGLLHRILVGEGDPLSNNSATCELLRNCEHPEVVCGMCSLCGDNLQSGADSTQSGQVASVPIVLGIPQILVSKKQAEGLAKEDKLRLLRQKKLALIVDLDQTLVHTSTDVNIRVGLPDVYGFRLKNYPLCYHARLRPFVYEFLNKISSIYELYIFTMGTHCYAHTLSKILDPERSEQRIISRDECFDSRSKLPTIRSVFPCGDEMVAIIDDREDMWARCPNLVHVKPYIFFGGTGDIHSPDAPSIPHTVPGSAPSIPHTVPGSAPSIPHTVPGSPPSMIQQNAPSMESHNVPDNTPSTEPQNLPTEVIHPPIPPETVETDEISPPSQPVIDNSQHTPAVNIDLQKDTPTEEDPVTPTPPVEVDSERVTPITDTQPLIEPQIAQEPLVPAAPLRKAEPDPAHLIAPISSSSDSSDSSESTSNSSTTSSSQEKNGATQQKTAATVAGQESEIMPPTVKKGEEGENKHKLPEISDPDRFLLNLIDILTRIHTRFYKKYAEIQSKHGDKPSPEQELSIPDLKEIIPWLRHSILRRANIVFTGVIPTNRRPEEDPLWNTARAFGATIHTKITRPDPADTQVRQITHVVASKPGTNKYREALRVPGIQIVTPEWVWACAERWKWVDEKEFPIRPFRAAKEKIGQHTKKPHLSTEGQELGENDDVITVAVETEQITTPTEQMDTFEDEVKPKPNVQLDIPRLSEQTDPLVSPSASERISFSLEDITAMNDEVNMAINDSSSSEDEVIDYPDTRQASRKRKRAQNTESVSENTTGTESSSDKDGEETNFDYIGALLDKEFESGPV